MIPVKVRSLEIGRGMPKICVPIVGKTEEEILKTAYEIMHTETDFVEWRADWFFGALDVDALTRVAKKLRGILGEMPILFTFRTKKEGGEKDISQNDYEKINRTIIESGHVDLVDIEIFSMGPVAQALVAHANKYNVKVIGSNHDFERTPERPEIVKRLCAMQERGADISKIAVMPREARDVDVLLEATKEVSALGKSPIITMSMGELGKRSRIEGEKYGSSITFGCLGQTSAPGQMEVNELKKALETKKG